MAYSAPDRVPRVTNSAITPPLREQMTQPTASEAHDTLRVERFHGGVRTITLDRPDRLNAVNPALADALPRALAEASADDATRVIVLTGAGRGFCAGLDLREPAGIGATGRADQLDPLLWVGRWVQAVAHCEKPVIAAVNGVAAGAGLGLALAADIRLLSASARLSPGYLRIGLSPDAGVSYFLPRLVGVGRAMELLLTARELDAAEAERIGLAAAVWDDAEFPERVAEYATRIAAGPAIALALTRRAVRASLDSTLEAQLAREAELVRVCARSADFREAIAAFADKRPPVFE